ncbi:hypothetical protein PanWU01x14_127850 [Parasponia andersonii]|uniref:Uncharacterized protein n=1 Tax=Parasponia andersonii TaxID=3476 RepID=A0A2P5CSI3_PARAD|nr:hypothetical protein PanWU01x14_127850 [Parasponia andersonii]
MVEYSFSSWCTHIPMLSMSNCNIWFFLTAAFHVLLSSRPITAVQLGVARDKEVVESGLLELGAELLLQCRFAGLRNVQYVGHSQ